MFHPAKAAVVGVLYPKVRPPYEGVFMSIIQGLEEQPSLKVKTYPLPRDYDIKDIRAWVEREGIDALVVLGQRGVKAAKALSPSVPVVASGVLLTPQENGAITAGISLAVDPEKLFRTLRTLAPQVERVFVVYHPAYNNWLIQKAEEVARREGLTLEGHPARSLKEAVEAYRRIFERARPGRDALWLPFDSTTVNDRVILPLVLEASWERYLVVFSSNPAHVQKGALFALYPDNEALGRRLGKMVLDLLGGRLHTHRILFLEDVKLAVNLRVAEHLGLGLDKLKRASVDMIFPLE